MQTLQKIRADGNNSAELYQLGAGIFRCLLYLQQYRCGKHDRNEDGMDTVTADVPAVGRTYLV